MKDMSKPCAAVAGLILLAQQGSAQEHAHGAADLASVSFPVTCSPEARVRMNTATVHWPDIAERPMSTVRVLMGPASPRAGALTRMQ